MPIMEKEWFNPVSLLKPDLQRLMGHITDGLPPVIQKAILISKIRIISDDIPGRLIPPVANLITKEIILQDVYLSFLWCCSYATVAFNNMYYEKAMQDRDIVTFKDRDELSKVNLTFLWARSLTEKATHWPDEAARPDRPDQWTDGATNLFQACVAYILFHEIGHLLLHIGLVDVLVPGSKLSKKNVKRVHDAEKEADEFALLRLIANSTLDDVLLIKYLGAALAHLSNFYLLREADARGDTKHPDLDNRLRSLIKHVKLNGEADQIQFQAHLSVGLQLFLQLSGKRFIPENPADAKFTDFVSLEKYLFGLIAQFKN